VCSPEASNAGRINFGLILAKNLRYGARERVFGRQQLGVSLQFSPGQREGSGKWQETKDSPKVREEIKRDCEKQHKQKGERQISVRQEGYRGE